MAALRMSVPGRLEWIDLGPGAASSGELRGSIATPVPACHHERPNHHIPEPLTPAESEARRIANASYQRAWREANSARIAARKRAWREANRERIREYERQRTEKRRERAA